MGNVKNAGVTGGVGSATSLTPVIVSFSSTIVLAAAPDDSPIGLEVSVDGAGVVVDPGAGVIGVVEGVVVSGVVLGEVGVVDGVVSVVPLGAVGVVEGAVSVVPPGVMGVVDGVVSVVPPGVVGVVDGVVSVIPGVVGVVVGVVDSVGACPVGVPSGKIGVALPGLLISGVLPASAGAVIEGIEGMVFVGCVGAESAVVFAGLVCAIEGAA
jgi:hypothetical protein